MLGAPPGSCLLQSGTKLASQGQSAPVHASSLLEDFATSHASALGRAITANAGASGDCKLCFEDAANEQKICIEKTNCGGAGGRRTCSAPDENFVYPWMGCTNDDCLRENRPLDSWGEAWEECGNMRECGAIVRWHTGKYYLRRADDPFTSGEVSKGGRVDATQFYKCRETCPPPLWPNDGATIMMIPTMDCVGDCINDNQKYDTFEEAWEACGQDQRCGFVQQFSWRGNDNSFFLRRLGDAAKMRAPCVGCKRGSIIYSCPPSVAAKYLSE